jgi:hypothetical protein
MAISADASFLLAIVVVLLFFASPAAAFGAGDVIDVAKVKLQGFVT